MAATKGKGIHAHACDNPQCRTRYEDACETPKENKLCRLCRLGNEWEELIQNRAPKDCCRAHSRPIRKGEAEVFRLAGNTSWWLCAVCSRTQAYDPTKRDLYVERRTTRETPSRIKERT